MNFDKFKEKQVEKKLEIQNNNITDIKDLIGDGKPSFMFYYLTKKFGYLLNNDPNNLLSKKEIEFRRFINEKIIKKYGANFLTNVQVFENRNTLKDPNDLREDKGIILPNEPVIWCPNHGFKDDPLATVLACQRLSYLTFASLPEFYNSINGITAYLNGVVMFNRKSKNSRNSLIERCVNVLNNGVDLTLYPEGILNKSMNELILNLWPGIYKISKESGAKIVPIIHYLRDMGLKENVDKKNPNQNDIIHTVVDDPIKIDDLSEKAALEYLRDIMATWKYLLMERYGKSTREELINESNNINEAFEKDLQRRMQTMDFYDSSIEKCADYRPSSIHRPEDVYLPIANIKTINANNAIHVSYANNLVLTRKKEDFQRKY